MLDRANKTFDNAVKKKELFKRESGKNGNLDKKRKMIFQH